MQTSIIMTITEAAGGKKRNRSITNINPQATNEELHDFATHFVALTTGTYSEGERVDKTSIDSGGSFVKRNRNMTLSNLAPNSTATITFDIDENEDKSPVIFFWTNSAVTYLPTTKQTSEDPKKAIQTFTTPNSTGTVYIGFTATENFLSDFQRVTCE